MLCTAQIILERVFDAKSDLDHLALKADNARKVLVGAVADLRAAGGAEEADRIVGVSFE